MSSQLMGELQLALHALKAEAEWAHKQAIGKVVPDMYKLGAAFKHVEQLVIRMDNE